MSHTKFIKNLDRVMASGATVLEPPFGGGGGGGGGVHNIPQTSNSKGEK